MTREELRKLKLANLIPGQPNMTMRRMNAQRFAKMVSLLMNDSYTVAQLAEKIDVTEKVVKTYIDELRRVKPKIIRVDDWVNTRGTNPNATPAFTFGSAPDEKRPPKKTLTERCRAYRARKKTKLLDAAIGGIGG